MSTQVDSLSPLAPNSRPVDLRWARFKRRLGRWLLVIPLGILAFTTIYPLFFTANVAFKTRPDWIMTRFAFTVQPTLDNFAKAWEYANMARYLFNSLISTAGAVILLSIICSMAGFALGMIRFRGQRLVFMFITIAMMIPLQVIMVPFYRLIVDLDLLNSQIGLILSFAAFNIPFGTYLMASYYSTIPRELLEAAKIDGASIWQTFIRVILPIGQPALATQAILATLSCWNNLLLPLLIMQKRDLRTVMVGIATLRGEYATDMPLLAAAILLGTLPVIIVFLVFQTKITQGMTAGSVKG